MRAIRTLAVTATVLAVAGCTSVPPWVDEGGLSGPNYFGDRTQPDVVLGYFTDARLKLRPLEFSRSARRPLDEYEAEDLDELRANPDVTIRRGEVHYRVGVLLSDLRELRERIPEFTGVDRMLIDACLR